MTISFTTCSPRDPYVPIMQRVRSLVLVCLAGVLTIAGCAGTVEDPSVGDAATEAVDVAGQCDDDALADALAAWHVAGFSGAVVVDGPDTSCRVGVGLTGGDVGEPITADTVFAIGSVSKAVVAAAVLRLEADGLLSLSDEAGRYVPGLSGPAAATTIESLLLHTSGLVGSHGQDHVGLSRDEAIASISGLEVDEASRGEFLYSNAGYTLLALVLEGASDVEYRRLLAERILPDGAGFWDGEPVAAGDRAVGLRGGEPTGYDGSFGGPHWAIQGNGDIAMSVRQLSDWTRQAFTGDLLPSAAVERMIDAAAVDDDGQSVTVGWGRLNADVLGEAAIAATGGGGDIGHEVAVLWFPDSERVVVVATNGDDITAEALLRAIGPAVVAGEHVPRPDEPVDVTAEELDAAVDHYVLPSGDAFEVTRGDDDRLLVTPSGGDALEALLPPGAAHEEVVAHEEAVETLLAGDTGAGVEEVAILEAESGELLDVEVLGTVETGELRTYVRLMFSAGDAVGWYALNDAGGIEGVDLVGLPAVALVATVDGFRVEGSVDGDDTVVVTFDDESMAVRGPGGTVVAERRQR